ncbi:unnamed protein product [Polarella glacialis]|uniref:GHMP kinase C-terminal domain-containing protein n=1 Tax=Polarella glacialis TaxID=89957 RepID=A0A813FLA3_POLGL|nr:unnamed protein product [Polarella glacialis]CAE8644066.1 unnamed protein product [Polarella glacialis]
MRTFGELAVRAKEAIEKKDHAGLADLMDQNFALRRQLYGDNCLGKKNLQMVEICKANGCAVKFPGSGGAVLGLCRPANADSSPKGKRHPIDCVQEALEGANYVFCPLDFFMPESV